MFSEPAVMQLTMTTSRKYEFVLRNMHEKPAQAQKYKNVKDSLLLTNEGEKGLKKDSLKVVKIHA